MVIIKKRKTFKYFYVIQDCSEIKADMICINLNIFNKELEEKGDTCIIRTDWDGYEKILNDEDSLEKVYDCKLLMKGMS